MLFAHAGVRSTHGCRHAALTVAKKEDKHKEKGSKKDSAKQEKTKKKLKKMSGSVVSLLFET